MTRAIVLGCQHGGLAVVRSLVPRGIDVLVLTNRPEDAGLASRHVGEWRLCPHPADEDALVQALLDCAPAWSGALVVPTTDYFAVVVSKHAERLEPHFQLGVAPWEHARIFLEKDSTYRLAADVGVAHPRIVAPTSMSELESELAHLELPAMIKPVHSHRFTADFGTKLLICDTAEQLRSDFQRVSDAAHEVVISEVIPGSDYLTLETCQVYIDESGELTGLFCCAKLRQTPPMYGVIRVGVSIEAHADLVEPTLELLRAIDYRGYASAEFKRDPRDQTLKLIEVNIRPLRMAQFSIACGVDFPYLTFADKVLGERHEAGGYEVGTYYIDVLSDLIDMVRFADDRNLRRFIRPYVASRKTEPLITLRDPRPFFRDTARRLRMTTRKAPGI